MDDHEATLPVAGIVEDHVVKEVVEDIVEEKVEEKLEDIVKHEVVEDIVEDKVEDILKHEVVEDIVEDKVEDILKHEVVEDIVEDKVEDIVKHEVVEDIVEDKMEDIVRHEIAEDIVEDIAKHEIVEDIVEDKLEEHAKKEIVEVVVEHTNPYESVAEDVVEKALENSVERLEMAAEVAEDIVEDVVHENLAMKARNIPSLSSSRSSRSRTKIPPPAYSKEDPIAAMVEVVVEEERQKAEDGTRMKSVLCALIICLGSFSFGTVIGYPSPSQLDINNHPNPFHLDTDAQAWVGSIIPLLALFGGLLGGPCMDFLGRRTAIMVWTVPFTIGWIIIIASPSYGCFLAGRAVTGLCTGVFSVICPVFIGEIAPPSIRGLLGSCHQLSVCLGILFIYAFGWFLPWNWSAFSCEAWILVLACGLCFIPESPRWLLGQKRKEETEQALLWLRGHEVNLRWEMLELEDAIAQSQDRASPIEFLQGELYKPLLISLGLMLFQQFSGINVIMFYGASIFEMAGIDLDPNLQNIIVGAVGVVGTLVSVFIADLAGRKILLVVSGGIMALSIAGMGAFFYEKDNPDTEDFALSTLSWLPVTALVLFNFGFNVAFGPIPWVMMSELFPLRAKALASSVATASNWLFAFILTKFWSDMTDAMTIAGAYWFCAAFCAAAVPFTIFLVPETKGRTLDEITASFK